MENYNAYKKYYERAQKIVNSFDKFFGECLQDFVLDKKEYDSLCKILQNT